MTTLLACIFTIGELQKRHELTAIKASGISLRKLTSILIFIGLIISITSFLFDNTLVSSSIKKRSEISKRYLDNNAKKEAIRKFHITNDDKESFEIIYIKNYNFINNISRNVSIQKIKQNKLIQSVEIDSMIWDNKNTQWICRGIKKRNISNNYKTTFIDEEKTQFKLQDGAKFKEGDLIKFLPKSDELNYWELKNLSLRRPENIRLKVDYNFKIAFSCTSLIMILFGIGLSIKKPRTNYATGIGLGVMVIFLYYIGIKFGQTLGYKQVLSPFISVWLINIIFCSIGTWLFIKIRT
tara:strand:- start:1258 stop:2145 length:888 start_codon:yes stop_codon:yes gene_type:complete